MTNPNPGSAAGESAPAADDLPGLVQRLGERLRARGERMCTVESCTGGGIAQALTDIAGSSDWFECGWVCYSNASKTAMVDVPAELIAREGAVSEAVARAMVEGGLAHSDAQLAVSVTGIAGPGGGTPDKPVGTVCFGWQRRGGPARVETRRFAGDRREVRAGTVHHALAALLEHELD